MRLIMLTIVVSGYRTTMALDVGIEGCTHQMFRVIGRSGLFFDRGTREAGPNNYLDITNYGYVYG